MEAALDGESELAEPSDETVEPDDSESDEFDGEPSDGAGTLEPEPPDPRMSVL